MKAVNTKGQSNYSNEITVTTKVDKINPPEQVTYDPSTQAIAFTVTPTCLALVGVVEGLANMGGTAGWQVIITSSYNNLPYFLLNINLLHITPSQFFNVGSHLCTGFTCVALYIMPFLICLLVYNTIYIRKMLNYCVLYRYILNGVFSNDTAQSKINRFVWSCKECHVHGTGLCINTITVYWRSFATPFCSPVQ